MSCELNSLVTKLLPPSDVVRLAEVQLADEQLLIHLTTIAATATCPLCDTDSTTIHSRYQRQLMDVPWGTLQIRLHLTVRKFVCRNSACSRRIFTERLPDLVDSYARKTTRLLNALRQIGLALGGQAGTRLAARLHYQASPATLRRLVRRAPLPTATPPTALGIDEWAWRRGHHYGTILVNLEDHRVIDLLPDRSADTVANKLAQWPTIRVVCRDRSALYADGIRRGAPDAVQVVDRFHLVQNLRQSVESLLLTQRSALQQAAERTAQVQELNAGVVPVIPMYRGRHNSPQNWQQRLEAEQQQRNFPRVATYQAVHALHQQGTAVATIARVVGVSRQTVYAYLRRETPPGPKQPQFRQTNQVLTPYVPHLLRRWREGCIDSVQLWREIQALGYMHSGRTVARFITQLRRAGEAGRSPEQQISPFMRPQGPSPRTVSFATVRSRAKCSVEEQTYLDNLWSMNETLTQANKLIQRFLIMVRERKGDTLDDWLKDALESGVDTLVRFARSLQDDLEAIRAGLTLKWSNGVTEGHNHRLKLIKRQAYGRAGFDFLRQRVLQAA